MKLKSILALGAAIGPAIAAPAISNSTYGSNSTSASNSTTFSNGAFRILDINGILKSAYVPPAAPAPAVSCAADSVLLNFKDPRNSQLASGFCSAYIQQTVIANATTSLTVISTATSTTQTTTFTTTLTTTTTTGTTLTTTTTTSTITSGVATTTITALCGVAGYGNSNFDLYQDNTGLTGNECHALCEANPECLSFGFGLITCALYSALAENFILAISNSPYHFYDDNCPDYPPPAVISKRQNAAVCAAVPSTIPAYLAPISTYPASAYSSACSCLITAASPLCTVTNTSSTSTTSTSTTITSTTSTSTTTSTTTTATTTTSTLSSLTITTTPSSTTTTAIPPTSTTSV